MSYIDDIRNSLGELTKSTMEDMDNTTSIIGSVISIDTANTCSVQPQDTQRTVIRNILLGSDSNVAPTYVPALGTQVTVTLFSPNSGFISQHGAVNSMSLAPGTTNYGGIVIVTDVVTRLNNIENFLNTFMTSIFNVHTHAVPSLGTSAVPVPVEGNSLTVTVNSDIENVKVTHGNGTADKTAYQAQVTAAQDALATTNATLTSAKILVTKLQNIYNETDSIKQPVDSKQVLTGLTDAKTEVVTATRNRDAMQTFLNNLLKTPQ